MKIFYCLLFVCVIVSSGAADCLESQPSVISGKNEHALFLTIHTSPTADAHEVAKVVANIQKHVDYVSPPECATEENEVTAGVGFGQEFYAKIASQSREFEYTSRTGEHGTMPATGGDVFIHAKSDSTSKLFELTQEVMRNLPVGSVTKFEDIYGFMYKDGRDLSGFIDGTENPHLLDIRKRVAVDSHTGGSFVLTQKWIHNMTFIEASTDHDLEQMIGRTKNFSIELDPLPPSSHVARMIGSAEPSFEQKFQIVRQSQPFGNLYSECGLFFIAYANSTDNHNFMLDNMVGKGETPHNDHIMMISRAVSGNFWYFPGVEELKELA